jgi:hypothetical protein
LPDDEEADMRKRNTLIVAAIVVLVAVTAGIATPGAQAQSLANSPPPMRVEVVPQQPAEERVKHWQPGRWVYRNGGRTWVSGRWVDFGRRDSVIDNVPPPGEPAMSWR